MMTMTSSFQNLITRLADEVSNDRPSQNPTFDKMNPVTNDPVVYFSSGKFDRQFIRDFDKFRTMVIYDGKTGAKNAPEPHIPVGSNT